MPAAVATAPDGKPPSTADLHGTPQLRPHIATFAPIRSSRGVTGG
jgi:hypothetical protein